MIETLPGIVKLVNEWLFWNAFSPMERSDDGADRLANEQPLKQYAPMDLRPYESVTLVKYEQFAKQDLGSSLTVDGIEIEVRPPQPEKA